VKRCVNNSPGADRWTAGCDQALCVHFEFFEHLGCDSALTARQPYGATLASAG
jgi:hypothetical protein